MEQFSVINAWLILMFRFLFVILDFRSILRSMYKPNDDQKPELPLEVTFWTFITHFLTLWETDSDGASTHLYNSVNPFTVNSW